MKDAQKMLNLIGSCEDPEKLRSWHANARKAAHLDLAEAAFRKLIAILPEEKPGSVEHDFWQTIHAFEHILKEERGKTVRAQPHTSNGRPGWRSRNSRELGEKNLGHRGLHDAVGAKHAGTYR